MKPLRRSLLVLLVALPCVGREDKPVTTLRVFYTGHSFHMFVPTLMERMTKAANVKDYQQAGKQGIGGSRVLQHWDKAEEMNQAKKALETGRVDVFTMAPHLKMPDEGIDRFVELGLKHNPRMRFLVQESWMPYDSLDKRLSTKEQHDQTDLAKLRSIQEKWRGQMEAQVQALNQKAGRDAVHIVPAGDAVLKLRELVSAGKAPGIGKQSELFTDAIGHGKPPIQLITAYCNYACITGRSPIGIPMSDTGISDELNALLQRIAWETVTAYPPSGVKTTR